MTVEEKIAGNVESLTWLGSEWGGLYIDLDLVEENSLVISGGLADDISFDDELITRKNCYVVGVDPTKLAAKTIRKYHAKSSKNKEHFTLLRKAIHRTTGLTVHLGGPANTFLSPVGERCETISLDDLVCTYYGASILKIDIEGAEFPSLEGLVTRLRMPQICIGFHVWLNSESDQCPNAGVPSLLFTAQDAAECVEKIKSMGYKLVYEGREDEERVGQETLFIRNEFADKYHDIELRV